LNGAAGGAVSGFTDDAVLSENLEAWDGAVTEGLEAGRRAVRREILEDFASSGCDELELLDPYEEGLRYRLGTLVSLYCASEEERIAFLEPDGLREVLTENGARLFRYERSVHVRTEETEDPETGETVEREVRILRCEVRYRGEQDLASEVFRLDEAGAARASEYARNLSLLLRDGEIQMLSGEEALPAVSYEGAVFTDGAVPVVYYSQRDPRWCDLPYGTDTIGGSACGPASMAIVVSSLTPRRVDVPHMAYWAYEQGYWCAGSGSYRALISGACKAWGLPVEKCPRDRPERIREALRAGKLVVAIMGPGHFTRGGHYIVLRAVTPSGTVLVADPASRKRSLAEWDLGLITEEASHYSERDPPFWIVG